MPWSCRPIWALLPPVPAHVGRGIGKRVRWRLRHDLGLSHAAARATYAVGVACVWLAPIAVTGGAWRIAKWEGVTPAPLVGVVHISEPSSGGLFLLPALFLILFLKRRVK